MERCKCGIAAGAGLLFGASLAIGVSSAAYAGGNNDCGSFDNAETEPCLEDGATDENGGCNNLKLQSFVDAFPGTWGGTLSTYLNADGVTMQRDTDWYLLSPETLAAADEDGNGILQIRSTVISEAQTATFIVTIGTDCDSVSVPGETGWSDEGCSEDGSAFYTVFLDDHPDGIVAWVGTADSGNGAIVEGYECDTGLNDYVLEIELIETFTECGPGAGACNQGNGTGGCDDVDCCQLVCDVDPACCIIEWDAACALIAVDVVGCAVGLGAPTLIASGDDNSLDGYLDVFADGLGSQAAAFGGGPAWLDNFNPTGGDLQSPGFTNTTFYYTDTERASLSLHDGSQGTWGANDVSVDMLTNTTGSDTNDDGVNDTSTADFTITGDNADLFVTMTQSVQTVVPEGGGDPVGMWTISYEIANNGASTDFRLVRWGDYDMAWVGGATDDSVGTGTNGAGDLDRYVYTLEDGSPNFSITISSPNGGAYCGSKQGFDPDGAAGEDPPFGFGTDTQVWNAFGLPGSYLNQIAGVGQDTDGESGTAPVDVDGGVGGDGSIGLQVDVSLGEGESTTVTFMHTYGAISPGGATGGDDDCPWDLSGDGFVNGTDLILLLGSWGDPYGTFELIELVGAWGPCPK